MFIVPINVQKIGIFGKWQKLIHCAADNKLLSTKLIIFVKTFAAGVQILTWLIFLIVVPVITMPEKF